MARMLTRLIVAPVEHGKLWITEAPFVVETKALGVVEIPAGFLFDGNSVPRLTWIVSPPSDFLEAGCLHDWAYRYTDNKKKADEAYKEMLELLGLGKFRAQARYLALKLFGGAAFKNAQASRKVA